MLSVEAGRMQERGSLGGIGSCWVKSVAAPTRRQSCLSCGERISLNTLLDEIGKVADVKLDAEYLPARIGDVRDSLASIDAARALLGYEPKVKVGEGLARTFAAFKAMY